MMSAITGIFNILATPFTPDGAVDTESLRRLVDFQLQLGAYGLTILGVLGEASKLSVDERTHVMQTVVEQVNGRVPIVVGTSHPDSATCVRLSQSALEGGAAGVMVALPPLDGPSDEQIFAYYAALAAHLDGTIVVQDYPKVNNVTLPAAVIARIANEIPTARYLKLEDPPLMEKARAIRAQTEHMAIFGGLGGMFLLEELYAGTAGTMTGFAFTEVLVAVYQAYSSGDVVRATEIFDHYLPLIRYENQPEINLTIRKELLYRRGAMAHAGLRLPFRPIDRGTHDEITWVLQRVGITDPTQIIRFS
ncbi:MAG: dihydrodipicolinate synthase family protein [Phototrophicaceae bacterium]|jgi:4-hydroxy-tetrahydrodipicolinate synthase